MKKSNRWGFSLMLSVACLAATGQSAQFTDYSIQAGLGGNYLNHTASVADYDLDGDLDVYVGSRLAPNTLYRNEGDAVFEAVVAGVEDEVGAHSTSAVHLCSLGEGT